MPGPRDRRCLPRCATISLQAALISDHIQLGPCMHMAHVAPHADHGDLVLAAMQEKDPQRRQKFPHGLLEDFQSTTDFPNCFFIDDPMDMYPAAKIVLDTRPGGGAQANVLSGVDLFVETRSQFACHLAGFPIAHRRNARSCGEGIVLCA